MPMTEAAPTRLEDTAGVRRARDGRLKLLIVIPAYNEEASIVSIIERSVAAKEYIIANSPVTAVEVTVVSDGSRDRTVERARQYEGSIRLIAYEKNRGYGAAIKEGWRGSDADLLGFLDADGTCDPRFFANLCSLMERRGADVTLGCRLAAGSKMPLVRRIGNLIFALLLSFFSSKKVRDTASGMRVVRASSLQKIMPLPDGMHFTPAMSARAILSSDLRIAEEDMPYHEREGESKLRVIKDGLRFLGVIIEAAFLYRPSRPLTFAGLLCGAAALAWSVSPVSFYLSHRKVLEWMVYRMVVVDLLLTCSCALLCAGYLAKRVVDVIFQLKQPSSAAQTILIAFFSSRWFWAVPAALLTVGGALVGSSFVQWVRYGEIFEHWSRFVAMSVCASCAVILAVTKVVDYTLNLVEERVGYLKSSALEGGARRD
jgi:glycosyltransferase involved in cell wall biosynthesis